MALLDRVQIDERAPAPTAEQTNRLQTNIERALKRVTDTLTVLIDAVFGASGPHHSTGAVPDPGAVAGSTKFLREDAIWAVPPGGGGGTGPQGPSGAPGFFADADEGDWPLVMPGPVGASGTTGAAGARGANAMEADEPETPFVVPGPTGATGATGQGIPGAPGFDADDPDWPMMIRGPAGPSGAAGSVTQVPGVTIGAASVDVGQQPRRSGTFLVEPPGGFLISQVGKPTIIARAAGVRGFDEAELEGEMVFAAEIVSRQRMRVFWASRSVVRGPVRINYLIGA